MRCHPFVSRSYLCVDRYSQADSSSESSYTSHDGSGEEEVSEDISAHERSAVYDRRRAFFIDDASNAGLGSFHVIKKVRPSRNSRGANLTARAKVTAIAVREKGTKLFSNLIRSMYTVPSVMAAGMETWVAIPRTAPIAHLLFIKRDNNGLILSPASDSNNGKDIIERHILEKCSVLTVGQRCTHWFVMRQFRATGTTAGAILLSNSDLCQSLGLSVRQEVEERTVSHTLEAFVQTWFNTMRSTEEMMRGTVNEGAVLAVLSAGPFVLSIFECGMLSKGGEDWLSC